jgi:hypothetical protein
MPEWARYHDTTENYRKVHDMTKAPVLPGAFAKEKQ